MAAIDAVTGTDDVSRAITLVPGCGHDFDPVHDWGHGFDHDFGPDHDSGHDFGCESGGDCDSAQIPGKRSCCVMTVIAGPVVALQAQRSQPYDPTA